MSTYKQKPVAETVAATVAEHTSGKLVDTPVARATTAAREQEFKNRRNEYDSDIANLERMRTSRGSLQARYDGYVRVYARLERLANTLVSEFGVKGLQIPVFDPPAVTGSVKMRTVEPKPFSHHDGDYKETGGMGKSGKGLPTAAPVPGSGQDGNWVGGEAK